MEIFLNLTWAVLSLAGISLWLKVETRSGNQRRLSMIALVMLFVIIFPVISVSDDLWSIQNPAETDSCQRRDHHAGCAHHQFPSFHALPAPFYVASSLDTPLAPLTLDHQENFLSPPALWGIQNRPPPTA